MNEEENFRNHCHDEVKEQGKSESLQALTRQWMDESIKTNYSYHFEWLGRPIIQYPQDIVGTQQLLWAVKPDLIIETGVARGGSLIFYASLLELIAQCGGPADAQVLGIDIDIRAHNKEAILSHPMSKRIEMMQGSSVDQSIFDQVKQRAMKAKKVMVCLDSNHTHDHVLEELRLYAQLVSVDSYLIVFDTVVEDLPSNLIKDRPWAKGNNPKTAVFEFLKEIERKSVIGTDNQPLNFEIDRHIENQLLITVAPSGFLKRMPA
jgi:cephalosporin hydroxylase